MKARNKKGQFIYTGGVESEKRDKPCPSCGRFIMRKSTLCRSCAVSKSKFRDAKPICPICNKQKKTYNKGLCRNCWRGNFHFAYKGEYATYSSIHDWLKRNYGKPNHCAKNPNHRNRNYVWANKSGYYKRIIDDWQMLCSSCNLTDGIKVHPRFHKELQIYEYRNA